MTNITRANPSPRYRELCTLYEQLHREGDRTLGLPPQDTFPGYSLAAHVSRIKRLIDATGAKSILDYGAGKGLQYRPHPIKVGGARVADSVAEYWNLDEVACYDPGYPPYATLPQGMFDGVISTDVLEHCPEEDLPWILDEIFTHAGLFVYLNVACYPARKLLPNGENAHVTVRPPAWWRERIDTSARRYPELLWALVASVSAQDSAAAVLFASDGTEVFSASPPEQGGAKVVTVSMDGHHAQFLVPNDMIRWRVETLFSKEPVTIAWLRSVPIGADVLDVGANIGIYTVFAAIARQANVISFEPESQNYAILNGNLQLNGLGGRVRAFCAGLADRASIDRLYLATTQAGDSCHSLGAEVGFDLKPRPAAFAQGAIGMRYDDLVVSGQLPVPQYIKIDVDGFEHKVIRGMSATLSHTSVRSLLVELNPALQEHLEIRDALSALGFHWDPVQVLSSARRSGPFEGVAEHVFHR